MVANGVINGTGNNMFSPTVTASRQEALIIAVRMVEKLKGKTVDYTKVEMPTPTPAPTPTQPSGSNGSIVGRWYGKHYVSNGDVDGGAYFGTDGTFFYVSLRPEGVENFKGNYQVTNNGIAYTQLYRYTSFISFEFSVYLELLGAIKRGSREELSSFLDTNHPYYSNTDGWQPIADRTEILEFQDDNNMRTPLFAAGTVSFERVS